MTEIPVSKNEQRLFNNQEEHSKRMNLDKKQVGDEYVEDYNHSFSSGRVVYKITRIEANGDVYGVYESGGIYELDESDVI